MKKNTLFAFLFFASVYAFAGPVTFHVDNSGGGDLPGVKISYNDYGNHWVNLGTTNGSGDLATSVPDGTWDFRALKNYSYQIKSHGVSSVASSLEFQTSKYTAHVMNTVGGDLAGVEVEYNDYGNHYIDLSPKYTDASGNSSIELFPGNYDFRAKKNYSYQTVSLSIGSSGVEGTMLFRTSKYTAHVTNTAGGDFAGVEVEYNDYGNHYIDLSPKYTDASGNSSIELFPGNYDFRAKKNYSYQTVSLSIGSSGVEGTMLFRTSKYTAHVTNAAGGDFAGVEVEYNDYGNHYIDLSPKYTDASGNSSIELFPGNFDFRAKKNYSYQTMALAIPAPGLTDVVDFQTAAIKALVKDCDTGDPISGIEVEYNDYGNHWIDFSPKFSDVSGNSIMELFPGTFSLRAKTIYTYLEKPVTLVNSGDTEIVEFNPTRVCFQYAGTVKYNDYGNHWRNLPCDTYMFPGTYDFRFGTIEATLPISGCAMTKTIIFLKLTDHNGNPLAGGTGRGGYGSNFSTWHVSGSTDANGIVMDMRNGSATIMSYEMKYNNTTSVLTQDVTTNAIFEFQTQLITMRLETCDGDPLDGGHVRWGHGTYFGSYHFIGGNTGSSATGETTAEFFPGTYSFEMGISGTTNAKVAYNFPSDGAIVTWQTSKVTLQYSGSISFGGGTGDSRWFDKPSMELMPGGTYKFHFRNGYRADITIEDCSMVKSALVMRLIDSHGDGLAGGIGKYNLGGWQTAGTTDVDGNVIVLLDGSVNTLAFRMYWEGTYIQKNQNISSNSVVVFQTELVQMELHSSIGGTLAGVGQVNSGGWKSLGTTPTLGNDGGMELLPRTYAFRMYWEGTYVQKNQNIGADPLVIFETELVQMELHSSTGAALGGTGQVNSGGWKSLGTTPTMTNTGGMELLPRTYAFRMYWEGTYVQKNQNIGADTLVIFETELVQMELHSSIGGSLAGEGQVNSGGWKSLGTTPTLGNDGGMELLPRTYAFRMYWEGTYVQKNQNIGTGPLVIFETELVQMELHSSTGAALEGAGQVNSGGWKSLGTTPTMTNTGGMELLPRTYAFRMYWEGTYVQKNQNIGADTLVIFETELVQMELNSPSGPLTGEGQVNSGGWKSLGLTPTTSNDGGMELLPRTYAFRMYYLGSYIQKNHNVSAGNETVTFNYSAGGGLAPLISYEEIKSVKLENVNFTFNDPTKEAGNYSFGNNYPNPFSHSTTIDYSLPVEKRVTLIIYDASGKQVKILVDGVKQSGDHQAQWDGRSDSGQLIPGGVYYYQFRSGDKMVTKSMIRVD